MLDPGIDRDLPPIPAKRYFIGNRNSNNSNRSNAGVTVVIINAVM